MIRALRSMGLATLSLTAVLAGTPVLADPPAVPPAVSGSSFHADGVIRVASRYGVDETVQRIRADIAAKNIRFFTEIDQQALAEGAQIHIGASRLLLFGNPPLGAQFLSSNPFSGLDWPVRILVIQDARGQVWVAYTDFAEFGRRYGIADRDAQLAMATQVSASIVSSVTH